MFGRSKSRVLVVGAGPAGLLSALTLANRGIGVDIIDGDWRAAQRDDAIALHPGSMRVFEDLGVAPALLARGEHVEAVKFYQGTAFRDELLIGTLSTAYPFLLIISRSSLEEILGEHLRSEHKCKIKWNHQLANLRMEPDHVRAEIERMGKQPMGAIVTHTEWVIEKTIDRSYEFVIGADGYESVVRRILGVPWNEIGPAEEYAIFETIASAPVDPNLRIFFHGPYSNLLWPVAERRWQWSFQIPIDQERLSRAKYRFSFDMNLERARLEFNRLVTQRAPAFANLSQDVVWSETRRFERRLAGHLGKGRCWLVGNAAHLGTPIDIHSMDFELREAQQLASEIARVLKGEASLQALEDFDSSEETRWQRIVAHESQFVADDQAAPWVRENLDRIPRCLPATGEQLISLADQLSLTMQ